MTRPLVYVAGPLTNGDSLPDTDVERNLLRAKLAAVEVWRAGAAPVLPHLSWHWHEARAVMSHADWIELDLVILARCDAVLVVDRNSAGVRAEVAEADRLRIPVVCGKDLRDSIILLGDVLARIRRQRALS